MPYYDERVTGALDLLATRPETADLRQVLDAEYSVENEKLGAGAAEPERNQP